MRGIINAMRVANILDPIEHKLDQRVFTGTTPKLSIVSFIRRVYMRAFATEFNVPLKNVQDYVQLILTGSLTTYQYSDTSDCDVSVMPNYDLVWTKLGLDPHDFRTKLIALHIGKLDGTFLPGGSHPLQFFAIAPGIKLDDLYKPGLRSAYDLETRQWIVPPERERSHDIQLEFPDVYQRASEMADKMEAMLDSGNRKKALDMWKQVHAKRQLDQRAGLGDFCEGNIVYKWLVHQGIVDRLRHELGLQISTKFKPTGWAKKAMPPANQAPEFLEQYYQPIPYDQSFDSKKYQARGYDWQTIPDAILRLEKLSNWAVPTFYLSIIRPEEDKYWLRTQGFAERGRVWLHPLQTAEEANVTLWHEIQHLYQLSEKRFDRENYNWERPEDNSQYLEHPNELDAEDFAQYMKQIPLISLAPPLYDPHWVPKELHLDRGDWNENDELYELEPLEQGPKELAAMVQMFRTDRAHWASMWDTYDSSIDEYYYGSVKTAGTTMYHVAPTIDRPTIRQNGLDYTQAANVVTPKSEHKGNYMWDTLYNAERYAELMISWDVEDQNSIEYMDDVQYHNLKNDKRMIDPAWGKYDIWRISLPTDVPLKKDPYFDDKPYEKEEWAHPISGTPGAFALDAPIPAQNLQLVAVRSIWDGVATEPRAAKEAATMMHVIYDFEKDRITLGSKESDSNSKIIGEYEDNAVTLYEGEKQWINPTYFRRLWNYSYPSKPLRDVHYQAGEKEKKQLKVIDHPHYDRKRF